MTPVDRALLRYLELIDSFNETRDYHDQKKIEKKYGRIKAVEPTTEEMGVRYMEIITDFDACQMRKAGNKKWFPIRKSDYCFLWEFLLESKGVYIGKSELKQRIFKAKGTPAMAIYDLDKTLENLVRKLAKVGEYDKKDVRKWFDKTTDKISLRNLD